MRLIRPEIASLCTYRVPDSRGMLKLDAMENPYGWPEEMQAEWQQLLSSVAVNRYPDPYGKLVKARLREVMGVPDQMDIMIGNGSDELIQTIQLAVGGPGRAVLAPDPTFVMYAMIARMVGSPFVSVPLRENFELDDTAMVSAIGNSAPTCLFIALPNNPTGNLFDLAGVEKIIGSTDALIVIDEAYHAFSGFTLLPRLAEFDNVVIMRTLSKSGLAGLRFGYLVGHSRWLHELEKVRLPYNVNTLTQVGVEFALRHSHILDDQVQLLCDERHRMQHELMKRAGVGVFPSHTNFLTFRIRTGSAKEVFDGLLDRRILIKRLEGERLAGCLRVTIGTKDQNDTFLRALDKVLYELQIDLPGNDGCV